MVFKINRIDDTTHIGGNEYLVDANALVGGSDLYHFSSRHTKAFNQRYTATPIGGKGVLPSEFLAHVW